MCQVLSASLSPLILQTALRCYYYPHHIDEETGSGIILKSKSELVTSLAHRLSVALCFLLVPFQLLHDLLSLNSPASSPPHSPAQLPVIVVYCLEPASSLQALANTVSSIGIICSSCHLSILQVSSPTRLGSGLPLRAL